MRENNIKGWMSQEELEFLYDSAREMKKICELGSYLGRSTVALAEGCKGTVTAVDHWKGAEGLEMDGTEYEQFLKNTQEYDNIEVVKGSSFDVSKLVGSFDMVFIDADHTYRAVKEDIALWLPKTSYLICGHDYDFEDVKDAVDHSLDIDGVVGSIWYKWL